MLSDNIKLLSAKNVKQGMKVVEKTNGYYSILDVESATEIDGKIRLITSSIFFPRIIATLRPSAMVRIFQE